MDEISLDFHTFSTQPDRANNILEFLSFDLRDVNLGVALFAIQTPANEDIFEMTKEIVRDAIDEFATKSKPLTATDNLEKVFNSINNNLKTKINTTDYGKIQSAFLYLRGPEMHFSIHNDFKIILIRQNRILDVVKMTYGLPPRDYEKLFSRMYSGDLKNSDKLLLTTSESWDCYDTEKIPEILNKLSAKAAGEFLKNYLPETNPYKLGGIILSLIKKEKEIIQSNKIELTPSESIKELLDTEDSTSQWLSPTPWQRLKKFKKNLTQFKNKIFEKTTKKTIPNNRIKTVLNFKKTGVSFIKSVFSHLNASFIFFIKIFSKIFQKINKKKSSGRIYRPKYKMPSSVKEESSAPFKNPRKNTFKNIPQIISYHANRFLRLIYHLPKTTKSLLFISVILIIIFISSLFFVNRNNLNQQANSNFEQSVSEIKSIHTQANQATIFKDFSRARSLLIEANSLINELPANSKKNEETKNNLLEENKQQLNRANRLTVIPLPLELTNLQGVFKTKPSEVEFIQNKLAIASENKLVLTDPENGNIEPISLPADILKIEHIINEDNAGDNSNLLILHDDTNITRFSPADKTFQNINNTIDINKNNIPDLTIFNDRLYRLDSANNQIWRHLKTAGNFQAGQAWLNVPNDLSKTHSIIIDGLIYILGDDIMQFNRGARTDWKAEKIEPSINQATKITKTEESDFLYILDPANQRFLIFDTEGSFIQQFTSPAFDDLTDFQIVETEEHTTAWLLNGVKIFVVQFSL